MNSSSIFQHWYSYTRVGRLKFKLEWRRNTGPDTNSCRSGRFWQHFRWLYNGKSPTCGHCRGRVTLGISQRHQWYRSNSHTYCGVCRRAFAAASRSMCSTDRHNCQLIVFCSTSIEWNSRTTIRWTNHWWERGHSPLHDRVGSKSTKSLFHAQSYPPEERSRKSKTVFQIYETISNCTGQTTMCATCEDLLTIKAILLSACVTWTERQLL